MPFAPRFEFSDHVPHVVRREELALLHVDRLPVLAAATSKSVCRHRNAGICSTSTTSAARIACDGS
jgi:hypothetical protein